MGKKRMFSTDITESDKFVEMPASTQNLYFHLGLHGDDDGFVSSPKRIMRSIGSCETDLTRLVDEGYIIPFESGVIAITEWNINNNLRNDRYKPTIYTEEKAKLSKDESGRYTITETVGIPNSNHAATVGMRNVTSITEQNKTEQNETSDKADKPPRTRFIPPTVEEVQAYCLERGNDVNAERFIDYYTANGWMVGRNKMKDWRSAVRTWEKNGYSNGKGESNAGYNGNDAKQPRLYGKEEVF